MSAANSHKHITPEGPLKGVMQMPGDKSISHRALILAALSDGVCRLEGVSTGEDILTTVNCLRALGVSISQTEDTFVVQGVGLDGLKPPREPLDCGNSGTTMRLLAGVMAGSGVGGILDGDQSLRKRPMRRVLAPLRAMGAACQGERDEHGEEHAPLRFASHAWLIGHEHRPEIASAQVKSAILLAGLWADGVTRVREPMLSRDHTERMLWAAGLPIAGPTLPPPGGDEQTGTGTWQAATRGDPAAGGATQATSQGAPEAAIAQPAPRDTFDAGGATTDQPLPPAISLARPLSPLRMPPTLRIPGDPSSAAFFLGAALLIPGSDLQITGLNANPTRLGFVPVLQRMGAHLTLHTTGSAAGDPIATLRAQSTPTLRATTLSAHEIPSLVDEIPLLAVLATAAHGNTVIQGASELRIKESDRLSAITEGLRRMGAQITETPDGLEIHGPTRLRAAEVDAHGDHRIAMGLAVAALAAEGTTTLQGAHWANVSFPGFFERLAMLTCRP